MANESERMRILEMIESGHISAEEGLQLLESLVSGENTETTDEGLIAEGEPALETAVALPESMNAESGEVHRVEADNQAPAEEQGEQVFIEQSASRLPPEAEKWRSYWIFPLWIGVGVIVLGSGLMYRAMQASGLGFWFVCASLLFILGVLILTLASMARTSPWLHLRVQQKPGERPQRIAFSFPIPVRPTAWFLRTFGQRIPGLKRTSLDEVILSVGKSTSPDNPLYIQVDEGEDGEKVEIYIG